MSPNHKEGWLWALHPQRLSLPSHQQAEDGMYKLSASEQPKPQERNWDFPVLVPKHTKMDGGVACHRPQRFQGFVLLRTKCGGGEVGALEKDLRRCEGRSGGVLAGSSSLPLVWIPQRCFPSFVLELVQGKGKRGASCSGTGHAQASR